MINLHSIPCFKFNKNLIIRAWKYSVSGYRVRIKNNILEYTEEGFENWVTLSDGELPRKWPAEWKSAGSPDITTRL